MNLKTFNDFLNWLNWINYNPVLEIESAKDIIKNSFEKNLDDAMTEDEKTILLQLFTIE